ncbi:hypothetical protein H9L05_22670 (plasmid) [Hymenobacter qilianensis]|uniref:Uncharacterized protein n=1 Tax=Hymenobacter qilianensis TaxID=1385715 RepID=A0A7H0H1Y9_9BACT|nr:hypothetical protein [Hymenobacter qilianensis]QNP54555.1 hypothetical protein H9L05_22670 [Hymenobacter qilianensis]
MRFIPVDARIRAPAQQVAPVGRGHQGLQMVGHAGAQGAVPDFVALRVEFEEPVIRGARAGLGDIPAAAGRGHAGDQAAPVGVTSSART